MARLGGPAALAAELSREAAQMQQKASQAVAKAAFDTQARARASAPVDTGNLRNSITVDAQGTRARVGAEADYAIYVEMGTSRMAAQPFMNPAADAVEPSFLEAMSQLGLR